MTPDDPPDPPDRNALDSPTGAHRLARIMDALARLREGETQTDEKDLAILEKRAALAARAREAERDPDGRLLVFRAAGQTYAVDLQLVSAITIIRQMTPLPGVPRALAGLLNVRGRNVTAVDLGLFLGGRTKEARRIVDAGKAITVRLGEREIAFVAEELVGIREVFPGDLQALTGAPAADPVKTMTADGVHVLDVAALLIDPRLYARSTRGAR